MLIQEAQELLAILLAGLTKQPTGGLPDRVVIVVAEHLDGRYPNLSVGR
ncbi:MAG: hypothetical protein M3Q20_00700 [Actinomycetota bacterium]|nr:hypothetical protein [Actinomycetota bacterium]